MELLGIDDLIRTKNIEELKILQWIVYQKVLKYRNKANNAINKKEAQEYTAIADDIFKNLNYINYNISIILDSTRNVTHNTKFNIK